jgi:hypothetical protein
MSLTNTHHNDRNGNYSDYTPHYPTPIRVNKPASVNDRTIINQAWAGDKHHAMHVREWFYHQGVTNVTNQAMEHFISNDAMRSYILSDAQGLLRDYNLFSQSNVHHYGTAFECEYYTNMEFVGMYWRSVRLPTVAQLINYGCSVNLRLASDEPLHHSAYIAAIIDQQFQTHWLKAVSNTTSALQHLSTYQNILLSLRLMYLAMAHFLTSFIVDR